MCRKPQLGTIPALLWIAAALPVGAQPPAHEDKVLRGKYLAEEVGKCQ
ncbi:MAG: hypothetical protein HXY18_08890 [Bryobacteraceae bacterium]|nr:hypothetical protein [Bryobacteraceae bacterium]